MMCRASALSACVLTVALGVACGGDDGGAGADAGFVDNRPIELRGGCDDDERVGRFRLEVILGDAPSSSLAGSVLDRVDPTAARELVASEGDCKLLRRLNPLCEPACQGDELCAIDDQCVPRARGVDVGPIRVGGLATDVEMLARPPGNNYFDTEIAHPAVTGGEEIRLRATDGDLAIDGLGSEDLVLTGGAWAINPAEALSVTWDAPTLSGVDTTVAVSISIDQHGTTPVNLVCEFADDGSADIPASTIDQLFTLGVSGFPNATIERRTTDSQTTGAGCVEFQVVHPRRNEASVAGHTPCNGPGDCPNPQVCDIGSNTCVDS